MSTKDTAALAVVPQQETAAGIDLYDRITDPMKAIEQLGGWFASSGLFGVQKKEQGIILAMACLVERKTPLEIARTYHVIEGRLSKRADAMQAEFQQRGGRVIWEESTGEVCRALFVHSEYAPKGIRVEITLEELQKSGVAISKGGLKDNYRKFPRQMLRARVLSEGIRMVDPSIVAGAYTPEEISDFDKPAVIDVPQEEKPAPKPDTEKPKPPKQESKSAAQEKRQEAPPREEPPKNNGSGAPIVERVAKAVELFRAWGITPEDIHRHVTMAVGEASPMDEWTDAHLEVLTNAYRAVKSTPDEHRKDVLCSMFDLEPGALG